MCDMQRGDEYKLYSPGVLKKDRKQIHRQEASISVQENRGDSPHTLRCIAEGSPRTKDEVPV